MTPEARIAELEQLNREYAERADAAEQELARLRVNRSRFTEYLHELDIDCRARWGTAPLQTFTRDPALPGTSDTVWSASVGCVRAYGKSGEAALKALLERVRAL